MMRSRKLIPIPREELILYKHVLDTVIAEEGVSIEEVKTFAHLLRQFLQQEESYAQERDTLVTDRWFRVDWEPLMSQLEEHAILDALQKCEQRGWIKRKMLVGEVQWNLPMNLLPSEG